MTERYCPHCAAPLRVTEDDLGRRVYACDYCGPDGEACLLPRVGVEALEGREREQVRRRLALRGGGR